MTKTVVWLTSLRKDDEPERRIVNDAVPPAFLHILDCSPSAQRCAGGGRFLLASGAFHRAQKTIHDAIACASPIASGSSGARPRGQLRRRRAVHRLQSGARFGAQPASGRMTGCSALRSDSRGQRRLHGYQSNRFLNQFSTESCDWRKLISHTETLHSHRRRLHALK